MSSPVTGLLGVLGRWFVAAVGRHRANPGGLDGIPAGRAAEVLATRKNRVAAVAATTALLLTGLVATPFAQTKLPVVHGFMPAFGAAMIVSNLVLATLLFSNGASRDRGEPLRLGTAYLFVAAIFLPYGASFPGAFIPGSVIGLPGTAVWLWGFWHAGFGLAIIRYAVLARRPQHQAVSTAPAALGVVMIVGVLTGVAICLPRWLPASAVDGASLFSGPMQWIPTIALAIICLALVLVCRLARTLEHLWLTVAMVAAIIDVWLTWVGTERYVLGWYVAKCCSLVTTLTVLVTQVRQIAVLHHRLGAANAVLNELAHQDGLTGLCNRRFLDERINIEWRRSRREQQPLSLLMIDVDYFKGFNDHYGHLAGDECLRWIAAMLTGVATRPGDVAARFGGEEFVVLLPATDAIGAVEVARRVQAGARELAINHAGSPLGRVTVSVGMATAVAAPDAPAEALVAAADRGVYRAKHGGRDQICWAEDRQFQDAKELLAGLARMQHPS